MKGTTTNPKGDAAKVATPKVAKGVATPKPAAKPKRSRAKPDPTSYAAIRRAVAKGETLTGYERRVGARNLYASYYRAEIELGKLAKVAATPRAVAAARSKGVRWLRLAAATGLTEAECRTLAAKGGVKLDASYVGRGRRFGRVGNAKGERLA